MHLDSRHSPWACQRCLFQQSLFPRGRLTCRKLGLHGRHCWEILQLQRNNLQRPMVVWELHQCRAPNREHSGRECSRYQHCLCTQWEMHQRALNVLWHYSRHFAVPSHWSYQRRCSRLHSYGVWSWIGGPCSWIRRPAAHPQLYSDKVLHNWVLRWEKMQIDYRRLKYQVATSLYI